MKSAFALLLVTLLVAQNGLAHINIDHKIPDSYILASDAYSQDLEDVYDVSEATFPITTTSTMGEVVNELSVFNTRSLAGRYDVKTLTTVVYIGKNIVAYVFDKHKVVFQYIDATKTFFGEQQFQSFDFSGDDLLYCTGFEYNEERKLIYVGCFQSR